MGFTRWVDIHWRYPVAVLARKILNYAQCTMMYIAGPCASQSELLASNSFLGLTK
jgi:hypothetical protein